MPNWGEGSEGSLAKDQTFSGFSFVHPSLSVSNCFNCFQILWFLVTSPHQAHQPTMMQITIEETPFPKIFQLAHLSTCQLVFICRFPSMCWPRTFQWQSGSRRRCIMILFLQGVSLTSVLAQMWWAQRRKAAGPMSLGRGGLLLSKVSRGRHHTCHTHLCQDIDLFPTLGSTRCQLVVAQPRVSALTGALQLGGQ